MKCAPTFKDFQLQFMGHAKRGGRDGHGLYDTPGGDKNNGDCERQQQRGSRHVRLIPCRVW